MVRKATLDRSAAGWATAAAGAARRTRRADRPSPRSWRGAGGRWMVWVFRVVIWAVLLIIGYRGVTAIVQTDRRPSGAARRRAAATGSPSPSPRPLRCSSGQVYLNFSPADRASAPMTSAVFLPSGADPQFGWNGSGSQNLQSEQVASISVQDAQHAVVRLLAQVNGQLIELGVPVYADQGGLASPAEPALLPRPGPGQPARAVQPPHGHGRGERAHAASSPTSSGLRQRRPADARAVPRLRRLGHRARRRGDVRLH